MKTQEIRETFLDFFSNKNHKVVKSSPLLPKDDPSILFTNAGMNQFKNVFLGLEKRSYSRAASVQKCMRVSGKHNDLDQVGKTNKHHTFFEMLGNFSFGDYFKHEAIVFAWELMTEIYKFPREQLYATVFEEDDEAYRIWMDEIGLPETKIFRMGKEDNYWSMGETGPCGPCSEIHYDLGPGIEEGDPRSLIESGSERFIELWNLVFMQFNQDEQGNIEPLPSPSVDTGMGLERMAAVLQEKTSNFETDLFRPLIETVGVMTSRELPAHDESDVPVRIIADHVRAVAFLIGDGIMPANDGRGYVLRRLIRRAFRAGNSLGLDEPFLYKLVGVVSDVMKDAYPELLTSSDYIAKVCLSEEKRFAATLSSGIRIFQQYVAEGQAKGENILSGDHVFRLYDTFGFPLDLSRELAEEAQMSVDEEGFYMELEKQRERARQAWKGEEKQKELLAYDSVKDIETRFLGYDEELVPEAEVMALMRDSRRVEMLKEDETGEAFLAGTPFYAEAGGQVGDTGILKNPHFSALVEATYCPIPEVIAHRIKVLSGELRTGDLVEAAIDSKRRASLRKNHTATHLLHATLRQILGDHVKQAGSLVAPERFRFDFTHFSPLSSQELQGIESLVNEKIQEAIDVTTQVTTLEEGIAAGAIAIFEEKYLDKVRMVSIGEFSRELCGGVHVHNTGEIGVFKIVSEGSIAAGMRRIEAVTGPSALQYIQEGDAVLQEIQQNLNVPRQDVIEQLERLLSTLKNKEKEIKSLRQKMAHMDVRRDDADIRQVGDVSVIVKKVSGVDMRELRGLADSLKQKLGSGVVVLGTVSGEKAFLVSAVSKDLVKRISADQVIERIAPLIGGGGGGRPDFAQAGGSRPERLDEALRLSLVMLEEAGRD